MKKTQADGLFANAADCLLRAMLSEPGSAAERRYLSAVKVFMAAVGRDAA